MNSRVFLLFGIILIPLMLDAQHADWFEKGLDASDPKEKIIYFTKCIDQEDDLAAAYFCRAGAKLECNDIQGAIDDYSKCIEIDPGDASAYFSRGLAKQSISPDDPDAVADIFKAYEIDPVNPSYINMVNELYLNKEDYPNAIIFYNQVLQLYPENLTVLGNLGYCYLAVKDYSSASDNFNKVISIRPEKIDAILGLALVYFYNNDPVNAKKQLDKARTLKPLLKQGVTGFEAFKKEGFIYNQKDNEALKAMFSAWK
ncbi:MAG: hypothetical protein Q8M08_13755 [Bacteroidales bacterium]|nr:hypothetical protein [Bacteroidales bacterium]